MSIFYSCHLLLDHIQFTLIHGPNNPGSSLRLFFTPLDFTSTTKHIHNWVLFLLLLSLFIPSGAICSSTVALSIIYLFTQSIPLYVAIATQTPFYSWCPPHPPRTSTAYLGSGCPGRAALQGGHSFLLACAPPPMPGCCFCGYFPHSMQSPTRSH